MLAVVLGAVGMNSSQLQGAFGTSATWAVSADSPSGSAAVSSKDGVFVFDLTAPSTQDLKFQDGTHFDFTFASAAGYIDPYSADGTEVYLMNEAGNIVARGYMSANTQGEDPTGAWAAVYIQNATWSPVQTTVAAGKTESFKLVIDSASLMNEDAKNNELTVSMNYKGTTLKGNTLQY